MILEWQIDVTIFEKTQDYNDIKLVNSYEISNKYIQCELKLR